MVYLLLFDRVCLEFVSREHLIGHYYSFFLGKLMLTFSHSDQLDVFCNKSLEQN